VYIFTKVEKTKADVRFALIEDHIHGNTKKHIQGACAHLIEGVGAFRLLHNCTEGEKNVESVLKPSCYGRDTSSSYVAGVLLQWMTSTRLASTKKSKDVCCEPWG
jgi:hypothetical protein